MLNFSKLFKAKGMNAFVEAVEAEIINSATKLTKLEERVRDLENELEIASSLLVTDGSGIAPVDLVFEYAWRSDDLGDLASGLDVITFDKSIGMLTRWGISGGSELKFILPINLQNGCSLGLSINKGTHIDVIKSMLVYLNEKRCNFKLSKNDSSYLMSLSIPPANNKSPINFIIKYAEKVEENQRHTLGVIELNAKVVRDE